VFFLDVHHDAAVVAVEIQESRGEAAARGAELRRSESPSGRFDLDDVGARSPKPVAAERPRDDGGKIPRRAQTISASNQT